MHGWVGQKEVVSCQQQLHSSAGLWRARLLSLSIGSISRPGQPEYGYYSTCELRFHNGSHRDDYRGWYLGYIHGALHAAHRQHTVHQAYRFHGCKGNYLHCIHGAVLTAHWQLHLDQHFCIHANEDYVGPHIDSINFHQHDGSANKDDQVIQHLCNHGQLEVAVSILSGSAAPPPSRVYFYLLKACAKEKILVYTKEVQAHLAQHCVDLTGLLGDYLVVALAKCGAVDDACRVLQSLPRRTVFSWTAIISASVECGRSEEAIRLYKCMLEDRVKPDHYTFTTVFKACGKLSALQEGKNLHAYARQCGFASDTFVGNTLVSMYGRCGAMAEAWDVFSSLSDRDVVSWNTILTGYVEHGEGERALLLFRQMQAEGKSPSNLTFVAVLQACGIWAEKIKTTSLEIKKTCLDIGQALHADAHRSGVARDVFVGNTLVSMYGKCGGLVEAEKAFNAMFQRSVVSWNAMLSAYVEHGKGKEALQLYVDMHRKCDAPEQRSLVIALQACCILAEKEAAMVGGEGKNMKAMCLEIGQALHMDARSNGFVSDVHICSVLVSMYGKCGSITEAENVFGSWSHRDTMYWNEMLSAYLEVGQGEKAMEFYARIHKERVSPDKHTLVLALQACGIIAEKEEATLVDGQFMKMETLEIVHALHCDVREFSSEAVLETTLLRLYARCGTIVDAERIFVSLLARDVVSWTAMLSAYVDQGQGSRALLLFRQMEDECLSSTHLTYVMALKACTVLREEEEGMLDKSLKLKAMSIVRSLHAGARRKGFISHAFVANTLVYVYGKYGAVEQAEDVFNRHTCRDVVSWTGMLTVYVEHGQAERALQLYAHMQGEGFSPNEVSFMTALQACCMLAEKETVEGRPYKQVALDVGRALHTDAAMKNCAVDFFVGNTLVSMYGKCGSILEVEEVFTMLSQHDAVSWTVILCAYIEHNRGDKALSLYAQMQDVGVILDDISITCILQACGETGSLETCQQLHFTAVCAGYDRDTFIANSLIHTLGSCASTIDGRTVFYGIPFPHLPSWNAHFACHAWEGNWVSTLSMFQGLQLRLIVPDEVTLASILAVCSHAGLVRQGLEFFESMSRYSWTRPGPKHFTSLLDLFGRAGDFKRVADILKILPMQVSLSGCLSLLGACRIHSNIDLAQFAFDNAMELEPNEAAVYVLMSNL